MTLVIALVALILKKIITSKRNASYYREQSALRGCLPAPTLHSTNLLGTSRLKESIAATKADRGPQYIASAMDEVGEHIHTIRVPILDYELLVTRDPANVKAMLSTQSTDYDISATRASAFMPLMGDGVFTARGERWKHSRALVRPQFAHDQISNLALFEDHVQILLSLPSLTASTSVPASTASSVTSVSPGAWTPEVDLQPLFYYLTLDSATEFLYGQSVHSQTAIAHGEKTATGIDGAAFSRHMDAAKHFVDRRGALGKFSWMMRMGEMNSHCDAIHSVIDSMVDSRLSGRRDSYDEKMEDAEKGGGRKFVLLDELAKLTSDRRELRNETLHTLLAGRDTTGALLGWVFYFLARYPRVYAALRETVLAEFGSEGGDGEVDFQRLRRCEYIHHVMNESIRVAAVIPMSERSALRDTTLPTGGGEDGTSPIFVKEGTQILIPKYAMQHRRDIWGEDVEEFKPERWVGRKVGWEWVPFGGGPRKCLGRKSNFLLLPPSSCMMLIRLIQNNSLTLRLAMLLLDFFRNMTDVRTWRRVMARSSCILQLRTGVEPE